MPRASRLLTPGAAIRHVEVAKSKRIYKETPVLELLGIQDELQARLEWCERLGKTMDAGERVLLREAIHEIKHRPGADVDIAREEFRKRNRIWSYFPDEGPLRRELYPRHMEFIGHTADSDEVMMIAANKIGKSLLGAYCITCWTTGRYPPWWHGRRFEYPTTFWIANKSAKDVRDINERELLGPPGDTAAQGTAMLPGHLIAKTTPKAGIPNGFEFIHVKHVSGGTSYIVSKSYDQGRTAFEGRNIDGLWDDEELPREIYDEQFMRIMTPPIRDRQPGINGIIIVTYTPILGLTPMTEWFMEESGFSIEAMRGTLESRTQDSA